MRKSDLYLLLTLLLGTALFLVLSVYPSHNAGRHQAIIEKQREAVRELHLTDLCLFTEARYARHLSQADLHSAFQDHPLSMEHFPSGSLVLPPKHLTERDVGGLRLEAGNARGKIQLPPTSSGAQRNAPPTSNQPPATRK